ncbi:MAG: hypothetical protein RIB59_07080 [Rhodospirillales bacterium]
MRSAFWFCLVSCLGTPVSVFAQDFVFAPKLEGELVVEIQNDRFFKSAASGNKINDLFTTTEPLLKFSLTPCLSVTAHGVLEPVKDPKPGDDRAFNAHGLFMENLYAALHRPSFSIKVGKFTPNFGKAWDVAPGICGTHAQGFQNDWDIDAGIYGTDFTEDYEFTERVGIELGWVHNSATFGDHRITASSYFQDRSFLSQSLFANRGQTRASTGKPGNTADLSSFALALDGSFRQRPEFRYHLGYTDMAKGEGNTSRQRGYLATLKYNAAAGPLKLFPMFEYAYFDGWDGTDNQTRSYITGMLRTVWKEWSLVLSYTDRTTDPAGGEDIGDNLFQASVGYDFGCKVFAKNGCLHAEAGYRYAEEESIKSHAVGILLVYSFSFERDFKK